MQERRVRKAGLYRAAHLLGLLPRAVNEPWQADVTYLHTPGNGWWRAVTVIDYFSRYLLGCHFTSDYWAVDVNAVLDDIAANVSIDASRVYSTGISNGGFFSQRLACELSDRIAATYTIAAPMPE